MIPDATRATAEVFRTFLRLGLTSFGGPAAHLGYFHDEFVKRRKWLDEGTYADLVALCQLLPGPASSQLGMCVGLSRAGLPGALVAWTAFTLPSAIALILFGYGITGSHGGLGAGALQGLKVVAVAVVAQAVWSMARTLCPDRTRATLAVLGAIGVLSVSSPFAQVLVIAAGGLLGLATLRPEATSDHVDPGVQVHRGTAMTALALFLGGLIGLPILASASQSQALALVDSFYRSGALVFGGGHVVLPLLQSEVVARGWLSQEAFLAGYGAAQAVPGPLFTFAAYLGTVMIDVPRGVLGGAICLFAIFAPSFLLVVGVIPFWDDLRRNRSVRGALLGVNGAVVGLLLAALYDPVFRTAIRSSADLCLALAAFALLAFWKVPPWLVVILAALGGSALHAAAV